MPKARMSVDMSRMLLRKWIIQERRYADSKYPDKEKNDDRVSESGIEWWMDFIPNYLSRAQTLGLETERGRQALGKAITTAMDCLEAAIRVHGPMPPAGAS